MKQARYWVAAAALFGTTTFGLATPAVAARPSVPVAIPHSLFNPVATRSWVLGVQALVARILKEECRVFPVLCSFVPPRLTTVPPTTVSTTTTVVPPPTTVTSVPTTVITTVPTTVITLPVVNITVPVPLEVPASSGGTSTCTVTMTGGGVAQCNQSASVSSSG
jgi:hypothetical protein